MIDLHVHSTASDGSVPPEQIPALVAAAGLRAVALTDHDTVAGVPAFLASASAFPGLEAVPGVELSTLYCSREMHFVGLFIDPDSPDLAAFLASQQRERRERAERMRRKLVSLGYPLTAGDLEAAGGGECPGRPHFARALVMRHGFASVPAVFDRLLKRGAAAFVPRQLPPPALAIAAIHAAGGVAVWAHPVYRQRNERAWAKRIMRKFAPPPVSLDAVEGYYSLFGPGETALITELAAANGLVLSGGSDFHGENTPNLAIGTGAGKLRVPDELLEGLKRRRGMISRAAAAAVLAGAPPAGESAGEISD